VRSLLETLLLRPVGTLTACLCIVILGGIAWIDMPLNFRSKTQYPVLTITTVLSDTNPSEMEILITKRIEDALSEIQGIRKVMSSSRAGESVVTMEFHQGRNISEAALEVRSALRRLWRTFPTDTRFPVITRFNPSDAPMAVLAVTGESSSSEKALWVNRYLRPQLSRINGVASVRVAGAPEQEIIVDCDISRLKALGLTVQEVSQAVKTGHNTLPAGFLSVAGKRISLRTMGSFKTSEDISAQPIIVTEQGSVINIGQIARVSMVDQEPEEISRYNGDSLIAVSIFRASDADLRTVWKSLNEKISELQKSTETPVKIKVIFNQAEELEKALNRLFEIIPVILLITGAILYLFLGNISLTLVVLAAIPFSLFGSILLMRLFGLSLDILSLSGLTLGLGILVDNAIVVIESVSRRRAEGLTGTKAVLEGTIEVGPPLFLSTLATIIVFVPLVFVSREIRLFFVGFAWTVSLSLAASLVAALALAPVLCLYLGDRKTVVKSPVDRIMNLNASYERFFYFSGRKRVYLLAIALIFLGLGFFVGKGLSFRQAGSQEIREYKIMLVTEPGTPRARTDKIAHEVESQILKLPQITQIHTEVSGNQGSLMVSLPQSSGSDTGEKIVKKFEEILRDREGVQFHVIPISQEGDDKTISLSFYGAGFEGLMELHDKVRPVLEKIPGIKDVMVRQGNLAPVLEFPVRHESLGHFHVKAEELAHHLRGQLTGPVATRISSSDKMLSVRVRAKRDLDEGLDPVERTTVRNEKGEMIPFMELAQPVPKMEPTELTRELRRPVLRFSLLLGDDDPLTVADRVRDAIEKAGLPPGFTYSLGDEIKDILRTRNEMFSAAAMGLTLIYLILIAATESLSQPLIMMAAVPFAAAGVVVALKISGNPINLPVYVGMIILCGLVLNVNIVMVYTMNTLKRKGANLEYAVFQGARRRLRPILMTSLTAVCGSIPMILDRGSGAYLWAPFALTLASGMLTSAIFSLALTPILYSAIQNARDWIFSRSKSWISPKLESGR
jgi:hydrophobic/amphiphilic exporter-1 (mainly G- bacteria), HAE1 family